MGIQFFTNWELWEQLTFVLAGGIVAVFFIGWIKLWWMQRLLKKHTLLDEEKRARQVEMRKSGLPINRKAEIPFGVRAIQSGVEVEGIWISRPASLIEPRSSRGASSTTLDMDAEPKPGDKGKAVQGSSLRLATTATEVGSTSKTSPGPSPLGASFEQSVRQDTRGPSSPGPQATYIQPHTLQRPTNDKSWTTRYSPTTIQAEGTTPRNRIETYVPTFSPSTANSSPSPRMGLAADRLSVSSEEGFTISSPYYPAEVHGMPYQSPFEDSESSSSAGPSRTQGKYCSRVRAETRGGTFESTEIDRTSSPSPQSDSRPSLASTRPIPVRMYTDQRENTTARVVNTGFEVLPAGTFGRLSGDAEHSPAIAR